MFENMSIKSKIFKELLFLCGFIMYWIKVIVFLKNRNLYPILMKKLQDNIIKSK